MHVYSVEGTIADTNAEAGTVVGVDGVTMEAAQGEVADATPTTLRCVIEAKALRPAIAHRGRSQPPGDGPLPWVVDITPIPAATLAPVWPSPNGGGACDCGREHYAANRLI